MIKEILTEYEQNKFVITDFVVGAPYGGSDGGGAIYVFHGGKDGVREKPTQVIEGRSIRRDIRSFGFAVAGGKDIDGNQYPGIPLLILRSTFTTYSRHI